MDAKEYRVKARELRELAEAVQDLSARAELLIVASRYEAASSPNWFPAGPVRTPLCGHRISSRRSPDRASMHCETASRCAAISARRWSASDVLRKKMAVALARKPLGI